MNPDLSQLTNTELKRYISKHRNDIEAFQAAMEVLRSRRNPANRHPYPFEMENPEVEVEALLREQINRST